MKIGIYTQPLRYNYGGILQAWALQTVLKRMGHEVVTFDPYPYISLSPAKKPFAYCKRAIMRLIDGKTAIRAEEKFNREHDIKIRHLKPFIDRNVRRMEFRTVNDIDATHFDVLIAGSDQVWRPKYNRTYGRTIEYAFFSFASDCDVKRIAYAASFGSDKWEYTGKQTTRCAALAQRFSAISVREASAVQLCKEHLGVEATHVLDPTLLLQREDYEQLILNGIPTSQPSGNLLCYVLDDSQEMNELIKKIAETKRLIPFRSNSHVEDKDAPIEKKIQPPVEQWLRDFQESEFVVTDSFHACVFAIIFRKPFVVLGNKIRGVSRYESLFDMLSLRHHLLLSSQEYNPDKSYRIDDDVIGRLEKMKDKSWIFLSKSLTSENEV